MVDPRLHSYSQRATNHATCVHPPACDHGVVAGHTVSLPFFDRFRGFGFAAVAQTGSATVRSTVLVSMSTDRLGTRRLRASRNGSAESVSSLWLSSARTASASSTTCSTG